jgi:hypothetical protein
MSFVNLNSRFIVHNNNINNTACSRRSRLQCQNSLLQRIQSVF